MRQNNLPLYASYVLKHHAQLFSAGLRSCGSWKQALSAAGIEVPKAPYLGRLRVLRALREFLDGHPREDIPQALRLAAAYYVGSVEKAIAESQTDPTILVVGRRLRFWRLFPIGTRTNSHWPIQS